MKEKRTENNSNNNINNNTKAIKMKKRITGGVKFASANFSDY